MSFCDLARIHEFAIPEESILKQFEKKIAPILMSVKNNSVESEKLSSLRDFLLPMLMNGQITFG